MNFALALAIAVNFWGARGVEVPCQPIPVPGAQLQEDPAVGYGWQIPMAADGCRILISSSGVGARKEAPNDYCAYVAHEVGHIAGLEHAATGPMASPPENPWYCDHWRAFARRLRR